MRECSTYLLTYLLLRAGQLSLLTDAIIQLNILEEYIIFDSTETAMFVYSDKTARRHETLTLTRILYCRHPYSCWCSLLYSLSGYNRYLAHVAAEFNVACAFSA